METLTWREKRAKKALFILPVLVLPFLLLTFWALGGGQSSPGQRSAKTPGINLQLPDAFFKPGKDLDKWAYYAQAEADSIKRYSEAKKDPTYLNRDQRQVDQVTSLRQANSEDYKQTDIQRGLQPIDKYDEQEAELMSKLAALEKAMQVPDPVTSEEVPQSEAVPFKSDATELSALMQQVNAENSVPDPALTQLDSMLDKIIAIQNGPLASLDTDSKERFPTKDHREGKSSDLSFTMSGMIQSIDESETVQNTFSNDAFISVVLHENDQLTTTIHAHLPVTQILVNGSTVKLELDQPVTLAGYNIPERTEIYGTTSLQGDRLQVNVTGILVNGLLLPVKIRVFDLDGLPGIHVPRSVSRESIQQSSGQAIQGVDIATAINPSLSVQAANAGFQAAKSLLTKRTRQARIEVREGYQLLLQVEK